VRRFIVVLTILVLLVPVFGCARFVREASRYFGATNFEWTGEPLQLGDTVLVDFLVREDASPDWELIHGEIEWVDLAGVVETPEPYELIRGEKVWYRVDVRAMIGGELFEYSCVSDDWIAVWSMTLDCYERAAE
jgi:hypothetical protein